MRKMKKCKQYSGNVIMKIVNDNNINEGNSIEIIAT